MIGVTRLIVNHLRRSLCHKRFSKTKGPFLHRHYPTSSVLLPSPHHNRPDLYLAVSPLTGARSQSPACDFPCCAHSPYTNMLSPLPRRNHGLLLSFSFTRDGGLPPNSAESASALPFSRPAQRSLSLRPVGSLSPLRTLLHREAFQLQFLCDCLDCYRLERPLPGGRLTH